MNYKEKYIHNIEAMHDANKALTARIDYLLEQLSYLGDIESRYKKLENSYENLRKSTLTVARVLKKTPEGDFYVQKIVDVQNTPDGFLVIVEGKRVL